MEQLLLLLEAYGIWGLMVLAFIESSFFPIPPDVLLLPMSIAVPSRSLFYALLCTLASVAGAYLGYVLGRLIGQPLLYRFASPVTVGRVENMFERYGMWAIVIAGLTPIPYKVFTIAAGCFSMNVPRFLSASLIGRGMRFFLEALFVIAFGQEAMKFISANFSWITVVVAAAIIFVWWLYQRRIKTSSQILAPLRRRISDVVHFIRYWQEGLFSSVGEWILAWGAGAFLVFFLADIVFDILNNQLHRSDLIITACLSPWIGGPLTYLSHIFSLPMFITVVTLLFIYFMIRTPPRAWHLLVSIGGAALIYWGYSGVLNYLGNHMAADLLPPIGWQGINMTLWMAAICAVCGGIRPAWTPLRLRWWALGLFMVLIMAFSWIVAGQYPSQVFICLATAALWMVVIWFIVLYRDSKSRQIRIG